MPQHRCLRATCSGSASGTSSGGASSWGWVRGSWRGAHGLSSRRIVLGRTLAIDRNGRAESVTVVIAPDSFKGSAAAHVVAAALERGKAVSEVTERAHNHGVPVALVAGAIDRDADLASFDTALALSDLAGPGEDPI